MKKLYPWQERIRRLLEPLLLREDFKSALELYRVTNGSNDSRIRLTLFKLPDNAMPVVRHLAATGELDYELVPPPVELISERDHTAEPHIEYSEDWWNRPNYTYIAISHNAVREDVEDFVSREWSNIEGKSRGHKYFLQRPLGPARDTFYAARDASIYSAYLNGAKPKQIALDGGLDDATVRQIIYRQKKKQSPKTIEVLEAKKIGNKISIEKRYISTTDPNEGEQKPEV